MLQKVVSFGAGKVHVFSDYDGTYLPVKHSHLHNPSQSEITTMNNYSKQMQNLFQSAKNDLHFHVTTGRSYGEFDSVCWLLKMRNFQLPLPESFIAKNGSDEHLKQGTDEGFYKNGVFPFSYTNTNKQKEDLIRQETNWDGPKIKSFISGLAKKIQHKICRSRQ